MGGRRARRPFRPQGLAPQWAPTFSVRLVSLQQRANWQSLKAISSPRGSRVVCSPVQLELGPTVFISSLPHRLPSPNRLLSSGVTGCRVARSRYRPLVLVPYCFSPTSQALWSLLIGGLQLPAKNPTPVPTKDRTFRHLPGRIVQLCAACNQRLYGMAPTIGTVSVP
jgi:hypothetical protein